MRKKRYWFIILALSVLFIIITYGCTKRKNPERAIMPPEGTVETMWIDAKNLENNAFEDPSNRRIYVYQPPDYSVTKKYPVLYLLHGYGANFYYYDKIHNIAKIADKLIARKEIPPMLIVMPDGWNKYGGSYYTNSEVFLPGGAHSDFGGRYEDYIAKELRSFIDSLLPVNGKLKETSKSEDTIFYKANRAIGGYDMGGYGALKIAMKYPRLFGSVSAMSPYPVYFTKGERDTSINGLSLYTVPQGIVNTIFGENNFQPGDTAAYYSMGDLIDQLSEERLFFLMPHTSRLFAMASAFSPHPKVRSWVSSLAATFFLGMYEGAEGIDLPMDPDGKTMWFVWKFLWRDHDLKVILDNLLDQDINPFEETDLYLDCSTQDQFALTQTQAFQVFLNQKGVGHLYYEYSGYDDFFAGSDNFLYSRLEEVLRFHSKKFPKPENRSPKIDPIGPQDVFVDSTLDIRITARDPDNDLLVLTGEFLTFEPDTGGSEPVEEWPSNAAFFDSGNGIASFSFTPDSTQIGKFRVKFKVSDGKLWDEETISVTVEEEQ